MSRGEGTAYLVDVIVELLQRTQSLVAIVAHAGQLLQDWVVVLSPLRDGAAQLRHLRGQATLLGRRSASIVVVQIVKDRLAEVCGCLLRVSGLVVLRGLEVGENRIPILYR